MSYATASELDSSLIPVVDIGPLRDGSDPKRVADELHRASRDVGFIYIRNHGISDEILKTARETALGFFHRDPADKEHVRVSAKHRGWLGQGGAKMQDDAKPDLKESFIWGYQDASGTTPEDHALRGQNKWLESSPDFEGAAMGWFNAAHDVARHLLRGFAMGLGLPEKFFMGDDAAPMSRASFVYYPPQPASMGDDQFGVGPHTDFGVLTVLGQDDVGGLQVQDVNGNWVAAQPIPGTLIVNVGDLLARWTNNAYRSTPHRVVNTSGQERLSLVLAYDPEPQVTVDPRAVFGAEVDTEYEPITCGDYLTWRFEKAFAYRKT